MVNRRSLKKNKQNKQKGGSQEYQEILIKYNGEIGSSLPSLERKLHLCLEKKLCNPSDWADFMTIATKIVALCNDIISSMGGDESSMTEEELQMERESENFTGKVLSSVAPGGKYAKKGGSNKKTKKLVKKGGGYGGEEGEEGQGAEEIYDDLEEKDPTERIKRPAMRLSCLMLKNALCNLFNKYNMPLNNC